MQFGDDNGIPKYTIKTGVIIELDKLKQENHITRDGPEFYRAGIQALVPRWRKTVESDRNYVEM
jgi:hypothetical protein